MSGYKRVNFYELCRLCASNNQKDKTHIFQEEGRKIQLQTKIQTCLSLNVYENDFLPKVVCSKCLQGLETCYTFQQECVNSETMLSTYFRNYRWTEDFKKSGKVYIKDTKPASAPEGTPAIISTASTVPVSLPQQKTTYQEIAEIKPQNNNTVETVPYYTLQLPTIVTNPNVITKNPTKNDVPETKIIQNTAAVQSFNANALNIAGLKTAAKQNEVLSNVVVNSNGEVLNISQLYTDFDTVVNTANNTKIKKVQRRPKEAKTVQDTIQIDDSNIIKIDLTESTDNFEKQQTSLKPVQQNIPKYTYNVKVEDKNQTNQNTTVIYNPITEQATFNTYSATNSLYSQSNINIVNSSTANGLIANSNVIQESSTINLNILNQGLTDINQGNFRSTVSHSFPNIIQNVTLNPPTINNDKIETPVTIVTNSQNATDNNTSSVEKSHICDVCKKSFKRREHLYQHVKLHTGFRPYRCDNCNKAFMRKEHLLRHMTLHSGQKNYTCNICEKSFSRRDNLLKHKKTHDKQTNFTCEICQKQFIMKHYYTAHRLTHGEKFQVATWDLIKT